MTIITILSYVLCSHLMESEWHHHIHFIKLLLFFSIDELQIALCCFTVVLHNLFL